MPLCSLPRRSLPLALTAGLLLATAGCDDGTSPTDLGGLDPVDLTRAVDALVAPLAASSEARANLRMALPDLEEAGVVMEWPRDDTVDRFPPDVAGRTFAYDASASSWQIVESRTGAPADGVRLLWYPLDSTGRIVNTDQESGHIDLRPGANGPLDPISVQAVSTADGSQALLDFTQGYSVAGSAVTTELFETSGVYADGSSSVNFLFASSESVSQTSGDVGYSLDARLRDTETRYNVEIDGSVTGATNAFDDVITATVERNGVSTVVEVRFRGSGGADEVVTGAIRHAGAQVASVGLTGDRYEFTDPDGNTITGTQATQLNRLFSTLTLNWYLVLVDLLIVDLPLFSTS